MTNHNDAGYGVSRSTSFGGVGKKKESDAVLRCEV